MKKSLLLFISAWFYINCYSNPLPPPPKILISELYFNESGWIMEVYVFNEDNRNLDSVILETSSGSTFFKPGITVHFQDTLIITSDSLLHPLDIDPDGDYINAYEYYEGDLMWSWDTFFGNMNGFVFGDYDGSECSAPYEGQSLVLIHENISGLDGYYDYYWVVKDKNPSIGYNLFSCSSKEEISGYIFDQNNIPIKGSRVNYCTEGEMTAFFLEGIIADIQGSFSNIVVYSKTYFGHIVLEDSILRSVSFNVELDSANEFTFIVEGYDYAGIAPYIASENMIKHHPNPILGSAYFSIDISNLFYRSAVIKIFNSSGQIIDILPRPEDKYGVYVVEWNTKDLSPGTYYYHLDVNGKKVAADKMLVVN